ncbi:MAG TPA: ribosome small subunit-dependent GTPase A [Ideonella sp.]|nr:ribosome small subunit-dependent GTPase A [Ideonella sp.]
MKPGLVVAGHGRHYIVETPEGVRLACHPRGKKSDCVVGDRVLWQPAQAGAEEGVIEQIEPRRNLLLRKDRWKTKSFAANLDQLLVLVAVEPVFGESQLARALIAAEGTGVPARIVLNKIDLAAAEAARARLAPYRRMGYEVAEVALKAAPDEARRHLQDLLDGRTTLALGPSGSGKSTLVNLLVPDAGAQVGEISRALGTGRHTTTATQWYWLDAARRGALIDTPGFQEFGLRQVGGQELPRLMPDLREASTRCRFYNCTHRDEPGCGVRAGVDAGEIAASRYRIYLEILDELERTDWSLSR